MSNHMLPPSAEKEDLLNAVRQAAISQGHLPGLALAPFASLLVKLSDETAETVADLKAHITELNKQNARLQGIVLLISVISLLSAIIQITLPFLVAGR